MTCMNIVVSGVISAVIGAVAAAIASFLIIRYQLKRNMQQATLLALEEALRRQKDKQREEARLAIAEMRSYSHSVFQSLHNAATARTAQEFVFGITTSDVFESLHKDVWLAATKVPASVIDTFYVAYLKYLALYRACVNASMAERDSDRWLRERQTEAGELLESFSAFVDEGAVSERQLRGEPGFPVHGSPTDYWPPSS